MKTFKSILDRLFVFFVILIGALTVQDVMVNALIRNNIPNIMSELIGFAFFFLALLKTTYNLKFEPIK